MASAAMRTIVVACRRPNIFPLFVAAVAFVEVSEEPLHGRSAVLKALNSSIVMRSPSVVATKGVEESGKGRCGLASHFALAVTVRLSDEKSVAKP